MTINLKKHNKRQFCVKFPPKKIPIEKLYTKSQLREFGRPSGLQHVDLTNYEIIDSILFIMRAVVFSGPMNAITNNKIRHTV